MPHSAMAGPAVAGPMMRPMLLPMVLTAIAPTNLSLGTNVGIIAERTGEPSAIKIPAMKEPTMAHEIVMWPVVTVIAMRVVMMRAPI